ncbi:MAG TPA: site-specific DNA-methyltransferase [bacterium]|nr:site-specific DNA-methyltransferase [bacterium]
MSDQNNKELLDKIKILENEIKQLKSRKKYGLVWEDKPEQVVLDCQTKIPVLKEVKNKAIITDKNKPVNILIEGDNYHSLSVLNYTHKGKIDVIYIDPPYNTGNKDFIYDDDFKDPFVSRDDSFRHSKWLSFMKRRLVLALELLAEDGVIFISIDDNEQAQLKLLCDSIFGENNFINCISVKTKNSSGASGGGEDKKLKKHIEYLLFYCKNKDFFSYKPVYLYRDLMEIINEKEENKKGFEYRQVLLDEGIREFVKTIKDGSDKDIKIYKHNKYKISTISKLIKEKKINKEKIYYDYFDRIFRGQPAQSSIRSKVNDAINNDKGLFSIEYIPRSGKRKNMMATSHYLNGDLVNWLSDTSRRTLNRIEKYDKIGTLWSDLSWNGLSGEGGVDFKNGKKPIDFIKRIMLLHPKSDITVLDFFAGSGSSGHAVIDLNNQDKQNRTFILCASNESNICEEKTYKRIYNVVYGYNNKKPICGNLRYLKNTFIDKNKNKDAMKFRITSASTEILCLKEGVFDVVEEVGDEYSPTYKIVTGNTQNGSKVIGIYFDINYDRLEEMRKKLLKYKEEKVAYIFSLTDESLDINHDDWLQIKIEPIPEKILKVYEDIYKLNKK